MGKLGRFMSKTDKDINRNIPTTRSKLLPSAVSCAFSLSPGKPGKWKPHSSNSWITKISKQSTCRQDWCDRLWLANQNMQTRYIPLLTANLIWQSKITSFQWTIAPPKRPGSSYTSERGKRFQAGELGHIFVGRFVSKWAILSPGDMLNTAELTWDEFLYSKSVLQIISTVKVSCFSCTFCCFQTSFC